MKRILLITLGLSVFLWADFTKNGDIVTDHTTTLEWQDDATGSTMNWQSAITYCEGLNLNGTGWRLPNINEVKTIIDDSKISPPIPAIVDAFTQTVSAYYWSSTTSDNNTSKAWNVDFTLGEIHNHPKTNNSRYVRCVRDGQ